MVAKGEHQLMANRSDRRPPTLLSVMGPTYEAAGMIRDAGARISIRATGASFARFTGRIYDCNRFSSVTFPLHTGGVHI
jgi:hypothetical protein